jgi:NADP-dependent 3-hydroxy acid dehydrogenase YdfG
MSDTAKERVVLVTGATSGIGAATARTFVDAGARVVATGRDQGRLAELAREVDLALTLDVTDAASVAVAQAAVLDRYGGVDVLVNNAGVGLFEPWDRTSDDALRRVMEVDFFGAVRVATAYLPSLRERRGVLVQVASVAGRRAYANHTAYCAAKHALLGWSDSLRLELAGTGCDVVNVLPPAVRTPFFASAGWSTFEEDHAGLALLTPEEVALAIRRASDERPREVVVGARARAIQWANRLAPSLLDRVRPTRTRSAS